jgi:hypothetical protein
VKKERENKMGFAQGEEKMSEGKTTRYNFEEDIEGWSEFLTEFKQRIKDDENELRQKFNKEIKIECGFMRNPEICPKPSYLLLGMEPTISEKLLSLEYPVPICYFPLFVHYCVYKHLCSEKFDYYITDLAKGAMSLKLNEDYIKKEIQDYRYKAWLPLFIKEWKLLGKPKIIVIGKELYDKFQNGNILSKIEGIEIIRKNIHAYIYHYSPGNKYFPKAYKNQKEVFPELDSYQPNEATIKDLKNFVDKFRNHLDPERYKQPNDDMDTPLGEEKHKSHNKKVFAVYRYNFEQFLRDRKILHNSKEADEEKLKALLSL